MNCRVCKHMKQNGNCQTVCELRLNMNGHNVVVRLDDHCTINSFLLDEGVKWGVEVATDPRIPLSTESGGFIFCRDKKYKIVESWGSCINCAFNFKDHCPMFYDAFVGNESESGSISRCDNRHYEEV